MSYDQKKGGGAGYGGYGSGALQRPALPEAPLKRIKKDEITNPCSGRYGGDVRGTDVEIMVDIDKTREFSKALNFVSGTITAKVPPWTVNAGAVHFRVMPLTFEVNGGKSDIRHVTSDIKAVYSDGTKAGGSMELKLNFDKKKGLWKADLDLNIRGVKLSYKGIEKKSAFFKEINLDMDYTEKPVWPIVEPSNLAGIPVGMEKRKIDAFSAFEDAGIKLLHNPVNSQQVKDPSPGTPWTKSDLYEVMIEYENTSETSDDNIWCMVGTTPPDKRYMGFSFNTKGRRGFGLFTGHSSFKNLEDPHPRKKAAAQRRFLHYLVHECGHCLGLKHPFEIGDEDSLSWMNYAWKYDERHAPGSFYEAFKYSFSKKELLFLRHTPSKAFRQISTPQVISSIMGDGYAPKTEAPDNHLADDDDDIDPESYDADRMETDTTKKPRPMRKIALDLKLKKQYSRSQLFTFEARIKNKGKLPAMIEGDLSVESGNLQLYISKVGEGYKVAEPFVRPIYSGYSKPKVLYTPEDEEGLDRYSQQVSIGAGSDGYVVDTPGEYEVRAVYSGGRYTTTSETYTVTIVDDQEEDAETTEEVLTAATLQSSSSERFSKAMNFWKKHESKRVEKKKSHVATMVALFEGLSKERARHATKSSARATQRRNTTALSYGKPAITKDQLLKDTDDLIAYYQKEGTKDDNFDYSNLVLSRGKLYVALKKTEKGTIEFNQLIVDIRDRGAKHTVAMKLAKKWRKVLNPPKDEDKYSAENLQKKVQSVLDWYPTTHGGGEPDLTGIGLGMAFNNFDHEQIKKGTRVIRMLFNNYEETQDLYATIGYADKLQKGREVNNRVLQWALEAFIVHSRDAKKAGIRYPEPGDKDKSYESDAAIVRTIREGTPEESWMNYWRCDADLNYHHRHWHIVYRLGHELGGSGNLDLVSSHLRRQGELFGYMHSQMLARYDAERESWGLSPVKAFKYTETTVPFNAGLEFHDDPRLSSYVPRPAQSWPMAVISQFQEWERTYKRAVEAGKFNPSNSTETAKQLTPNWAGFLLEPSSYIYSSKFGGLHNGGHMQFAGLGIDQKSSYMGSTETAIRDVIFYRWHKRIDNLFQANNNKIATDVTENAPPVTITADDIILSSEPNPPKDFGIFKNGWVTKAPAEEACLKTMLGPAVKRYEWDNKLDHERFYYHLRIKRNAGSQKKGALPLTIRIFICPQKQQNKRGRWIEMDKFVCRIEENQDYVVLTRKDVHSSVIKRNPKDMADSHDNKYTKEVEGFCDCGWPYSMLLPRGKRVGEKYVLFVMATDNRQDSISVHTHCGSMSYCGASGEVYPDKQDMGYPFAHPIMINDEEVPIPEAFDRITNAAYKTFVIENDAAEPAPVDAVDIWWPYYQLSGRKATDDKQLDPVNEFTRSKWTGLFEVLVDGQAARPTKGNLIMIRFMGRGRDGGPYQIRDVRISLGFRTGQFKEVTYKGEHSFSVPESGLISDPLNFSFDPAEGDCYITFTLDSPGAYLAASGSRMTSTIRDRKQRSRNIYCIAGIMSSLPPKA